MPSQALSKYENEKDEYNANIGSSAIASIFKFMCIMFRAQFFNQPPVFYTVFFIFAVACATFAGWNIVTVERFTYVMVSARNSAL